MGRTFIYMGREFVPCHDFTDFKGYKEAEERRQDLLWCTRHIMTDPEIGITENAGYDYEAFYEAAGGSSKDIFMCVDNGRLYVPGQHELWLFCETEKQRSQYELYFDAKQALRRRVLSDIKEIRMAAETLESFGIDASGAYKRIEELESQNK